MALNFLDEDKGSLIVNVGTGHGHSVREVIDMAEKVSGLNVPYEVVGRRLGDPPMIYADPTFAQKSLNWKSQLGLEEIVRSSFDWYQKNPSGYR
jgi:UDP-glucose 4-epimerase